MSNLSLAAVLLRARLATAALGPVLCVSLLLVVAAGATLAWLLPQSALRAENHRLAMRAAALPAPVAAPSVPITADDNLAVFHDTLGEKRRVEQQVKTLFSLAAKSNLTLSQGEYKSAFDASARLHSYQITLPVKGRYRDIWQFGMLVLRAIPFASLDEISFKRESIGEAQVEARLRFTLYLADSQGALR